MELETHCLLSLHVAFSHVQNQVSTRLTFNRFAYKVSIM